jgi:hypothetical protein
VCTTRFDVTPLQTGIFLLQGMVNVLMILNFLITIVEWTIPHAARRMGTRTMRFATVVIPMLQTRNGCRI